MPRAGFRGCRVGDILRLVSSSTSRRCRFNPRCHQRLRFFNCGGAVDSLTSSSVGRLTHPTNYSGYVESPVTDLRFGAQHTPEELSCAIFSWRLEQF